MDFLRKLFPSIKKAKATKNLYSKEVNEVNDLRTDECISNNDDLNSNDDSIVTNSTNINDVDVSKSFHSLENVPPIIISLTDNSEANTIEISDDNSDDAEILCASKENSGKNNENVRNLANINDFVKVADDLEIIQSNVLHKNSVETETDLHEAVIDEINVVSKEIQVANDLELTKNEDIDINTVITESELLKNVIDNETSRNLKEFDEALSHFVNSNKLDNFQTDIINLDEFNEIFDELETVNEVPHSHSKMGFNDTLYNSQFTQKVEENKDNNNNLEDYQENSNKIENIDVISINSSTADEESQSENLKDATFSDKISEDGYHSSDFEFISENEAKMDGFIINFRKDDVHNLSTTNSERHSFSGELPDVNNENSPFDPGEGPSRQKSAFEDRSYRNEHVIPEGDAYLGLFQGIYNPMLPVSEIYFLENKSIRTLAMNIQYDGIGFDKQLALRRHQPDSSEDEFEDEATENVKKILRIYPSENRKRRRRH